MKFPIGNSGRQRSLLASLVLTTLLSFPTVASPGPCQPIITIQRRDETLGAATSQRHNTRVSCKPLRSVGGLRDEEILAP